MIPIQTEAEMLQDVLQELYDRTELSNLKAGSIARTLVEIINNKIYNAYTYLETTVAQTFLSTATGMYLDLIGELLNCTRIYDETDDNYKYRITQQVFSASNANATAIRLACLAIDDVKDVHIVKYTKGSGSFSVYIITDELIPSDTIISEVEYIVNDLKAEGIRTIVTYPTIMGMEINTEVILANNSISVEALKDILFVAIQDYLDNISVGGNINIKEIFNIIESNTNVIQAIFPNIKIDNNIILNRISHQLKYDERIYLKELNINIMEE